MAHINHLELLDLFRSFGFASACRARGLLARLGPITDVCVVWLLRWRCCFFKLLTGERSGITARAQWIVLEVPSGLPDA